MTDDILELILLFFRENKTWHFMWIYCEMSSIIFSEK